MASTLLNSPFPSPQGDWHHFITALLTGIFVGVFLLVFQPFGMAEADHWNPIRVLGFGFVTFICLLIIYFVIPKLFPRFYNEANYTVGKDFITSAITVIVIGIGNSIYLSFWEYIGLSGAFGMIWNTFLVGIFPLTFIGLLQYNKLQRQHHKASEEINIAANRQLNSAQPLLKKVPAKVNIKTENEKIELDVDQLYFIESVGNYANVVHKSSEGKITRNLYRTTLKSIEAGNQLDGFIRCHRSYIINLNQVKEVNGNAQGLRLSLKDFDEVVPVSRKYVPDVKAFFA